MRRHFVNVLINYSPQHNKESQRFRRCFQVLPCASHAMDSLPQQYGHFKSSLRARKKLRVCVPTSFACSTRVADLFDG
jgi:hypothetical protein